MPGIFINYRREDSRADAGRLFDWLSGHFGKDRVFMDVAGSIEPGMDFDEVIEKAVTSCDALIVVLGKQWLTTTESTGRRRLDNPDDYVRLEIAKALQRNIRVIPVLVQEATMPSAEDLPEDLARLAKRQALEISDSRWDYDTEQLVKVLDKAGIKPVIRRTEEESTAIEAKVPPVTKKLSVKAITSVVLNGLVIAIYSAEEGLDQSEQIGALAFSIVALALGISAFYDIKLNKVKGKVLAITGILLSTLITLVFIGELSEPRHLPFPESASPPRIQPVPETAVPQPPVKRPQAHVDINGNSQSKKVLKSKKGFLELWIDSKKWGETESINPSAEFTLIHSSGDAYAMVIVERITMPLTKLKEIALQNARSVAPDIEIISEEEIVVNGVKMLAMRMEGTVQEIPLTYYGYYWTGKAGSLQVLTYTGQDLFEEFEADFADLLNGTIVTKP